MALTARFTGTYEILDPELGIVKHTVAVSDSFATVSRDFAQTAIIAEAQTQSALSFGGITNVRSLYITANKAFTMFLNGTTDAIPVAKVFYIRATVTTIKVTTGAAGTGDTKFEYWLASDDS